MNWEIPYYFFHSSFKLLNAGRCKNLGVVKRGKEKDVCSLWMSAREEMSTPRVFYFVGKAFTNTCILCIQFIYYNSFITIQIMRSLASGLECMYFDFRNAVKYKKFRNSPQNRAEISLLPPLNSTHQHSHMSCIHIRLYVCIQFTSQTLHLENWKYGGIETMNHINLYHSIWVE